MKHVAFLLCVASIAACSASPNTMRVSSKSVTSDPREVFNAKNVLASKTVRPHEASFTGFQAFALGNGDRVYCGQMDATLPTGARTGQIPFYVRTDGVTVKALHYKPESAEFASRKCTEVNKGSIKISPH
ncbi:hypothetical protein [Shimia sp. SDUM112013]|uniref:hypothetical protein n=1 Tax=Shimia sp. SDUM112013 TaxID=3136160 RepID=UPI0032EDC7B7